jgi:hypothetical protein
VARLAHAIALENPNITADVVEVEEFPSLAQMYMVRSVPKTVLSTLGPIAKLTPPTQFVGMVSEAEFVEKVLEEGIDQQPQASS